MRKTLGIFAAVLMASQAASAADIFVRDARGAADQDQLSQLTDDVKNAIRDQGQDSLVNSESKADFVLQPRVQDRDGRTVLRIDKYEDGSFVSSSQQPVRSLDQSQREVASITDEVIQSDGGSTASSDQKSSRTQRQVYTGPIVTRAPASAETEAAGGETRGQMGHTSVFGGPGYFTAGIGPSFAVGLNSDNVMYDLALAYNIDFTPSITGKAFGDFNIGSGNDTSRFFNFGVGANWYPAQMQTAMGRTYLTGDLGYGFTRRNETDNTRDNLAIGAGAGFQFMAQNLGMDISLHYTILTAQIDQNNPQVFGARIAVNF